MVTAIVAAAGRGRRFGTTGNKVFAPLAGRSVLHWSLAALSACGAVEALVLVAGREDLERAREIAGAFPKLAGLCEGGEERQESVWNGLRAVPAETTIVAVHDAARPLVSPALIDALIAAAREHGAAVPATPVSDTLKYSEDGVETRRTVDRRGLYAVQTPQVARRELLQSAYDRARAEGVTVTDEAGAVERLGHAVRLVPGERTNLKITVPEDLRLAEALLAERAAPSGATVRTGFGYDVHRLAPGRRLVLGGIELQHPEGLGLEGHSDADVLLHAIADALLGAAGLGDIGQHFPDTDPAYRGADSLALLRRVAELVRGGGWRIAGVDATLLAERPRIRPHVERMRAAIAGALGTEPSAVSVKATTNERLGFVGREEGMAAHAVATLLSAP